jgi:hypothetical protein
MVRNEIVISAFSRYIFVYVWAILRRKFKLFTDNNNYYNNSTPIYVLKL